MNSKNLSMHSVLTRDGYDALTPEERRRTVKVEQAKEYSGMRRYPDTCAAVFARIPPEWWDKYTTRHIGETAALLKTAYDDGKSARAEEF